MPEKVLYSSILQDFARPLLNAKDTDEIFMNKIKVVEIIWNYCIAKEFKLPVFEELHKEITEQNKNYPDMKLVFDSFVEFKKNEFDKYKHFIHKVELRINPKGDKSLYVESVEPKNLKLL